MNSQVCTVCGAPRKNAGPACPYCRTLYAGEAGPPAPAPEMPAALLVELDRGNLIAAIKIHRQVFKSSLRDAKEAVEALAARRGGRSRT
jgi:ribosomal protein L7/L12